MRISLRTKSRRWLFVILSIAAAAVYLNWAIRVFAADRIAASLDAAHLRRAMALDPGNARYPTLLGRYLFYAQQDIPGSLEAYRRALALDPHSAHSWLNLATALQVDGDSQGQIAAIDHAISADPKTPTVAWEAGNLLLVAGEPEAALRQFQTAFRDDIHDVPTRRALEMSWRAARDPRQVEAILPDKTEVWLDFIALLTEKKEPAAETAWNDFMARNPTLDAKQALFYVDYWIAQKDSARARRAWEQLAGADKTLRAYMSKGNLVVNGGFEHDFLNDGFDWRYAEMPGIAIALDTEQPHADARSLLLSYTAATSASGGVSQLIAVEPNATYRFKAYVRSEDISSANGPRIGLYDSANHQPLYLSDETLGTTSWHELSGRFTAGPDTTLAVLDIVRTSATTHINGKLWLDDVSLEKE